jgi:hypothetical protein
MNAPLSIVESFLGSREALRILIELRLNGYVIVPRNPTPEMLDAASDYIHAEDGEGTWRAMIEAAELKQ